ncbi:MAG: hypothetical protein M3R53_02720, partial [Candidatus Eremiobacteraeota bacterium]|nr:hypothetical protein [Candidatus Eremiobacteraeota bacterium]
MRRIDGFRALPCVAFAASLACGTAAFAQTVSPSPAPDVPAQMTFQNGDGYTGDVLVSPQAPIPNQPQSATVNFGDKKARSGYVVPDGQGQLTFDGWVLNSTFERGYASGKGTLTGPGGFHLDDGIFASGAATSGTVVYGDGNTYKGGLRNGCFAGDGTFHSKNGADATGVWTPVMSADGASCSGSRLSSGSVVAEATRYDGPLDLAGKPDGKGVFTDRHGRKLSGTWSHGSYAGTFVQREPSGWEDFRVDVARPSTALDGSGTYTVMDGSRIYGQFHSGTLEGPATLVDASGRRHVGTVSDGRFESSDRKYVASLDPYKDFVGPRDRLGRPDGVGKMPYFDSRRERLTFVVSGTWRHGVMTGPMKAKAAGADAPTFIVRVAPPGNELRGPAKLIFPNKNYWEEGTFTGEALDGPGTVRFVSQPSCRLDGVFHAGVMH